MGGQPLPVPWSPIQPAVFRGTPSAPPKKVALISNESPFSLSNSMEYYAVFKNGTYQRFLNTWGNM